MNTRLTFPEQPQTGQLPSPIVYVKERPVWEYRQLVHDLKKEHAPTEEELNALGADGWELAGVAAQASKVYLYFKRLA